MKKYANRLRLTLTLIFAFCLTPHLFSSEWLYIKEGGDWAQKEQEIAKGLEQVEAARIKIAENPGLAGESQEAALKRILMAESQTLEQVRAERERERQARQEAEFAETLRLSSEQAELENRQRAEREEQERQEREQAEQAQKASEEKSLNAEQIQQEREAKALADALRQIQEFETKAAQTKKAHEPATVRQPLSRQELEDQELAAALAASVTANPVKIHGYLAEQSVEDLAAQIEQMEEAARQEELKTAAPFLALYTRAIAQQNVPHIKPSRPKVLQQKDLECGYFSVINAALLYKTLQPGPYLTSHTDLTNPEKIGPLLTQAQQSLGCKRTLNDEDMLKLVKLYNLPDESYGFYSGNLLYNGQLSETTSLPNELYSIRKDGDINEISLVAMLKKLITTAGFTHIFFLYKAGADIHKPGLGHWISVVAHNNDNKSIDVYVLDSQYPQGDKAIDKNNRMNHDKMWQALVILLHETSEKLREEQPD